MILKSIQNIFHEELKSISTIEEIDSVFYMLIDHFYKVTRIQLALNPEILVENDEPILRALSMLKQQMPVQYIIGESEFYGLNFKVNEYVLIPRPETEELVAWLLNHVNSETKIKILDIGTGSGSIAISLSKHLPQAEIYAMDVSTDALHIARQNADSNAVNVEFIEADILQTTNLKNLKFDVIVSNPPYVREQEKALMKPNVLDNEPHLALFVKDNNALQFYKAIIHFSKTSLNKGGLLFFEINEYLGKEMISLLQENNYTVLELKQDIYRKDRMIKGVKS
ncbi:peptide chain release factor N(5)-glutamine methyltransferase [Algibacter mikhailovii]|uniref:peptide chain release factor N(5)-glutamine methyltransferase n=1 Tax=Algibacter mikhailovii TaxID=425498 RepID=UPI0024956A3E|nr:peptide chain release factor N(5)-glutamine methyltransferase [Algibacter mikhailovii]